MSEGSRTPLGIVLTLLRVEQDLQQKEVSRRTGINKGLLSDYETGTKLTRETLEAIVDHIGRDAEDIDVGLFAVKLIRLPAELPVSPVDPTPDEIRLLRRATQAAAVAAGESTLAELTVWVRRTRAAEHRREAAVLWERLRKESPRNRRLLVEGRRDYQTWSLAELLCDESRNAAAGDAREALELAELALRIAELAPGSEAWCARLQGYCWPHVGNARRVGSNLPGADQAFGRGQQLWQTGVGGDPGRLLDEGRLLDLEASLRRAQRRFEEALRLLNQALALDPAGPRAGRILLKKVHTLEQKGDYEQALAGLADAEPQIDPRDAGLLFALRFDRASLLCDLERYTEAEPLLPEVRELAFGLGKELHLIRLRWLDGRAAIGLGRKEEGLAALQQAQRDFTDRRIAFDSALVSMDVAVFYLEQGRAAEVRKLTEQMYWIFQSQEVQLEALKALQLFCVAARQDKATVELALWVRDFLRRAQHDPGLVFE